MKQRAQLGLYLRLDVEHSWVSIFAWTSSGDLTAI